MRENLKIGERVLMFTLDKNDYLDCIINKSYQEVTVKKIDNILSTNVVTVIDNNGNEYCGSYIFDDKLGKIFFLRKKEYIFLLRKYLFNILSKNQYDQSQVELLYKRINQECNHLFVKLKNGYWTGGFHSSDYEYNPSLIECVYCGLTNKNHDLLRLNKHKLRSFMGNRSYQYLKIMDEAFKDYIDNSSSKDYYRGNEDFINYLNSEEYFFANSKEVFQKVKEEYPNESNEKIFEKMKKIDQDKYRIK